MINEQGNLSSYYYHNGVGEELVKLGYVVIVIENRGWGERIKNVENELPRTRHLLFRK